MGRRYLLLEREWSPGDSRRECRNFPANALKNVPFYAVLGIHIKFIAARLAALEPIRPGGPSGQSEE